MGFYYQVGMTMRRPIAWIAVSAVTALMGFSLFVWPTPYRYEKVSGSKVVRVRYRYGPPQTQTVTYEKIIKVNRFTGDSETVYSTEPAETIYRD